MGGGPDKSGQAGLGAMPLGVSILGYYMNHISLKLFTFLVIMLSQFNFYLYAQNDTSKILKGYRNALFGQSSEEVQKNETLEQLGYSQGEEPSYLVYVTPDFELGKSGGMLVYIFAHDSLLYASLDYMTEVDKAELYLKDFQSKKSELISEFGLPDRDTVIINSVIKIDEPLFPRLLKNGELHRICNWFYENGQIVLSLANYEHSKTKLEYKLEFLTNDFLHRFKKPKSLK